MQILGDPATCPHGNPIPGSANRLETGSPQVPLAEVQPGQTVRFERLGGEIELGGTTLRSLDDAGFIPGAVATVTNQGADGTLLLDADGTTVVLGADLCQPLYIAMVPSLPAARLDVGGLFKPGPEARDHWHGESVEYPITSGVKTAQPATPLTSSNTTQPRARSSRRLPG